MGRSAIIQSRVPATNRGVLVGSGDLSRLLLETGDFLLLETGDKLLLEDSGSGLGRNQIITPRGALI